MRLQAMDRRLLCIQLVQPHRGNELLHHGVAVQVAAFESKLLKPGFHFIGSRVETSPLQAMGKMDSTCAAPPRRGRRGRTRGPEGFRARFPC
jgi:hypothetical protein